MPDSVFGPEVEQAFADVRRPAARDVAVDGDPVRITCPFASPEDWRDRWIYFALVDRFSNPAAPPVPADVAWDQPYGGFRGGTLEGVRQRLGYLQRLGVGAIWLSPVLQNCQAQDGTYHGYGIQHFLQVDPRFTSNPADADGELRRLVDEAHARGMHVIMDIVLHHAGDVFAYLRDDGTQTADAPWRDAAYPIRWRGADNAPVGAWSEAPQHGDPRLTPAAAIWPDELRANANFRRQGVGGEAAGDFDSLKEFVRDKADLRAALIRCHQYAVAKWDVDGFRIDTLKYIAPDFALTFGNAMREFALSIGKRNFFTFGEVYDGEEKIARFIGRDTRVQGDMVGVDAALDFPLFFRLPGVAKGMAPPTDVSAVYDFRRKVEQGIVSSHGEVGQYFVTFLDNHDQHARFRFVDPAAPGRFDGQVALGLVCLFALQGIPCVYYGTEQGLAGAGGADQDVREALWGKPGAFDEADPFYTQLRDIAAARAANPALRYGRQYFRPVSGDGAHFGLSGFTPGVLAFSRILNEDETVVLANCDGDAPADLHVLVDSTLHPVGAPFGVLYSSKGAAEMSRVERIDGATVGGGPAGTVHAIHVTLSPGEARLLARDIGD